LAKQHDKESAREFHAEERLKEEVVHMLLPSLDKRRFFLRRNAVLRCVVEQSSSDSESARLRLDRLRDSVSCPSAAFASFGSEEEDFDDDSASTVAEADNPDPMISRFNQGYILNRCALDF
jgi:hypothetical protein